MWRSNPNWLAVSNSRYPTGHFLANPQGGLGLQFAQLGRDASAAVSILHYIQSTCYVDIFCLVFRAILIHLIYWCWYLDPFLLQGAARRLATQKKNLEIIESTGAAGKPDTNRVKKYFRLEVNRRIGTLIEVCYHLVQIPLVLKLICLPCRV
jgi:5'-nucleotidase